jgi:hypothetical protein
LAEPFELKNVSCFDCLSTVVRNEGGSGFNRLSIDTTNLASYLELPFPAKMKVQWLFQATFLGGNHDPMKMNPIVDRHFSDVGVAFSVSRNIRKEDPFRKQVNPFRRIRPISSVLERPEC